MGKKLHIGNLAYSVTDDMLKNVFEKIGTVDSVSVVRDKISGRSKGFGFVEMSSDNSANDAIEKLNKQEFEGRMMFVSESRPREEGSGPSGGNRRRFGSGGGAGGGGGEHRRFNRD